MLVAAPRCDGHGAHEGRAWYGPIPSASHFLIKRCHLLVVPATGEFSLELDLPATVRGLGHGSLRVCPKDSRKGVLIIRFQCEEFRAPEFEISLRSTASKPSFLASVCLACHADTLSRGFPTGLVWRLPCNRPSLL